MLMECRNVAGTLAMERLFCCQKTTHTYTQQKQLLSCNSNSRHATPFRMSYDRLGRAPSARRCSSSTQYAPLATCHMQHAAYRMPDVPHTSLPPYPHLHTMPPPARPTGDRGTVVIWGFRIVVDRLLIFAIVLHAPRRHFAYWAGGGGGRCRRIG